MLIGKYWLLPGGRVVDVTTSEHAIYARKLMLRLADGDNSINGRNMCLSLTAAEIETYRRRGISEDVLNFLSADSHCTDPRVFVINAWGWVRGRFVELKSPGFWVRRIDDDALRTIREATDFWSAQKQITEFDMVDVTELATADCYQISVSRLRDPKICAAQLLEKAFRKPDLIDLR